MLDPLWEKYIVLLDLLLVVILLIWDRIKTTYVFFGGAFLLILLGIVSVDVLLINFANKSIVTIFLLIFITALIRDAYDIAGALDKWFGTSSSSSIFLLKLTGAVSALSSVMNNTPIVALLIPYVYQWGKKHKVSPSKLLIPLSFAAITGGMITVIGTSTNLVLNGFIESSGGTSLTFLDFALPGLGVSLIGGFFLSFFGNRFLPDGNIVSEEVTSNIREYVVETQIIPNSNLVGKTVSDAKLRNLDGVFLVEIVRGDHIIKPVEPYEVLQEKDRLYFAGDTKQVVDLVKTKDGLDWAKTERFNLGDDLDIVETVIPSNSVLEGKTLKEIEFRERFDAAVIAIHRNGERLSGKLGRIKLVTGDLLLVTTGKEFNKKSDKDKNLYTVSVVSKMSTLPFWKKRLFAIAALTSIALVLFSVISLVVGLLVILGAGVGLRLMNQEKLKKHTNLDLLVILGSAITLGGVFIESGASQLVAVPFIQLFGQLGDTGIIIGLFMLTLLLTSFVTNVAAVSIVFPLAYQLISDLQLNSVAVFLVIAFGASAAFLTPVSYQTNLMVYGPGNYRVKDFLKIGIPFTLLYSVTSLIIILTLNAIHG
jgi:di/tricarboxylate transporter